MLLVKKIFEFHAQVQKCHFQPGTLNWERVFFWLSKNLYKQCDVCVLFYTLRFVVLFFTMKIESVIVS